MNNNYRKNYYKKRNKTKTLFKKVHNKNKLKRSNFMKLKKAQIELFS